MLRRGDGFAIAIRSSASSVRWWTAWERWRGGGAVVATLGRECQSGLDRLSSLTPDQFGPQAHPSRRIKVIVEGALSELSADFAAMYARNGRPSIPPERLLRAAC